MSSGWVVEVDRELWIDLREMEDRSKEEAAKRTVA